MAREGRDQKEAVKRLYQITNTPFEEYTLPAKKEEPKRKEDAKELEAINKFCLDGFKKMEDAEELKQYLESRKISTEAINKYNLFISKDLVKGKKFLVIPIIEEGKSIAYIGRNLNKEDAFRYKNSKGTITPFNLKYIKEPAQKEQELLFICEGIFDAISIEEQGFKAISLNSTSNINKFINAIKKNMETAKSYKYIIATDTDEAGQKAQEELKSELTKLELLNSIIDIPQDFFSGKQYKDINEWLCDTDKETFRNSLEQNIYNQYMQDYLLFTMDDYYRELESYSKKPIKSTGFRILDEQLDGGIKSGLYVLGAIPSLRKNYTCIANSR